MKKVFIKIKGMVCASDTVEIEKSLLRVKGVNSATVNYLVHEGFVYVEEDVNKEDLESAVKKVGYRVTNIRFEEKNEKS